MQDKKKRKIQYIRTYDYARLGKNSDGVGRNEDGTIYLFLRRDGKRMELDRENIDRAESRWHDPRKGHVIRMEMRARTNDDMKYFTPYCSVNIALF